MSCITRVLGGGVVVRKEDLNIHLTSGSFREYNLLYDRGTSDPLQRGKGQDRTVNNDNL